MADRETVIKVLDNLLTVFNDEKAQKRADILINPFDDAMTLIKRITEYLHENVKQAFAENGFVVSETGDKHFLGEVRRWYGNDAEVMSYLDKVMPHGSKSIEGSNMVGDIAPDVMVVTMDTMTTIPLFSLHIHKNRPLLMAIVHSGSLHRLFGDYKNKVDFLFIYITEAHPADGWRMGSYYSSFNNAVCIEERAEAARKLIEVDTEYKTFTTDRENTGKIPIVLDSMNNEFNKQYYAQPDRVVIIENGVFTYIGPTVSEILSNDPEMLPTDDVRNWLQKRFL
uniref:Iodothyronine deiodinase n=1 Tax=Saccoglossus kowalevskii TaxID=10224 RepID=A0ABM0GWM2_SACKO|nr:PREDICTED: type I iodothyronine deiodinase-like [Saccoglossus kowalevskii]